MISIVEIEDEQTQPCALTEEGHQILLGGDQFVEHFIGDVLDLIAEDLVVQPNENILFVGQIACQSTDI